MIVQDKVVIVTGASSGIGEATARYLSQHGAKVVLAARTLDKLERLSAELKDSFAVQTDVSDPESISRLVQKTVNHFGSVDIVINNAGVGYDAYVEEIDIPKYKELFDVNVVGPLVLMQKAIPFMRKSGEGAIVNITSGTSLMRNPNIAAYASVKNALNTLTLTAREELKKDNIVVSLVYPYLTETNFGNNVLSGPRDKSMHDDKEVLPGGDDPKLVAEIILEIIESGEEEIYAHEWIKQIK